MKKTIVISGVFTLLLISSGCKKFLDKEPDDRAKLNSPEKVSELLSSAYPQISYLALGEVSSDNVGDCLTDENEVPGWSILLNNLYSFQDNNGLDEDGPTSYWAGCYKAIAAANQSLATIAVAPDPKNYQVQKGEALVARAYAHFMLVNFFAKFYDKSTASADPGIPYVTEPEDISIKKYERKTVQYVYDMIQKDLLTGLPLISNAVYAHPKYHFTKTSASAFAARYFLFKQEYDSVIKYANAAIPEGSLLSNLRPWNTVYTGLPLNGNNSLSVVYTQPTEKANLLLVETNSWWWRLSSFGKFSLTSPLASSIVTSQAPGSTGSWAYTTGSYYTGHPLVSKIEEYFVETSIGSGTGDGWGMVNLFSAEEVLFNLAEAYTYTGQTGKAISLLNTYLSTRIDGYTTANNITETSVFKYFTIPPGNNPTTSIHKNYTPSGLQAGILNRDSTSAIAISVSKVPAYYTISDNQKAVINTILQYRQSEFVHEGMRWFDILRYGISVMHQKKDATGQHVTDTDFLMPDAPHRVFQIPVTAQSQAGLMANPGPR